MKLCTTCQTLYGPDFSFCPRDETPLVPAPKETMALYDPMRGLLLDGRYRLATAMGSGTLGDVYAATFESMEKPVAIKILRAEYARRAEWAESFLELARRQATVEHRHLTSVTDFGTTPDGRPFFVMDWHSGGHLGELVHTTGPLPAPVAVAFARQIAEALEAAHQSGLIHQNLKPSNVRLPLDQEGVRYAVLTDLGLFTPSGTGVTGVGRDLLLYGNPQFMAPEQVRGQGATPATDVYQLGLLLYTMLSGAPPFTADSFHDLLLAQVQDEPPALPAALRCPPQLARELRAMLDKDPARRPASMREVSSRLHRALDTRRRWMLRAGLVLGLLLGLLGAWHLAGWLARRGPQADPDGSSRPKEPAANALPVKVRPVGVPTPATSPRQGQVRVFIDTIPTGARVSIAGQTHPSPAWFELPRGDAPVTGEATHPQRPTLQFTLIPRQTGQVFLHLDQRPGRTAMRPYIPRDQEPELLDPFH